MPSISDSVIKKPIKNPRAKIIKMTEVLTTAKVITIFAIILAAKRQVSNPIPDALIPFTYQQQYLVLLAVKSISKHYNSQSPITFSETEIGDSLMESFCPLDKKENWSDVIELSADTEEVESSLVVMDSTKTHERYAK